MLQKTTIAVLNWLKAFVCTGLFISLTNGAQSQTAVPFNDLSFFLDPASSWRIAGDVKADLARDNELKADNGTGILVNLPDKKNKGADLYTRSSYGDADIELDYMMAKGSNSGIYLQGRYEIQLLDSWGAKVSKAGSNGGIYERWDESKPEGQKGYQGYAPRQNTSRAPGLWQHLKISFQAPRFSASGQKIENAKMLRIELNGVPIHENVELLGPTRGAVGNDEVASGPLRIQGDHGPVAFRNLTITAYDKQRPELTNLKYRVYRGKFDKEPDYAKLPPEAEGATVVLSSNIMNLPDSFLIRYSGTLQVKEPGDYQFNLQTVGGSGYLKINNKIVEPINGRSGIVKATLPAGNLPFEMWYSKFTDWGKPSLGLTVAGPGIREYLISDANVVGADQVDPILVESAQNTILRSFMDMPNEPRITHAINVGSAEKVHYTYDMDKGMIAQVWRGGFLDATPMWHERGDGSSRPTGSVLRFGKALFTLAKLPTAQVAWVADTVGSGYQPKGYKLDADGRPSFRYNIYGTGVTDAIRIADNGQGVSRQIVLDNSSEGLYVRLAASKNIEPISAGLYLIDDKRYYIRIDNAGSATPIVREQNGSKELIIPAQKEISYSILF